MDRLTQVSLAACLCCLCLGIVIGLALCPN